MEVLNNSSVEMVSFPETLVDLLYFSTGMRAHPLGLHAGVD